MPPREAPEDRGGRREPPTRRPGRSDRNSTRPAGCPKRYRNPAPAGNHALGSWGCPWGSRTPGDRWGGSTGPQPGDDRGRRARSHGGRTCPCRSRRRRAGSPLLEPAPQLFHLFVREAHVPVARHEEVGNVPQLGSREGDDALALGDGEGGTLAQRREEIRQRGGAGVPVATTVVMQPTDRQGRRTNAECGMRSAECIGQSSSRWAGKWDRTVLCNSAFRIPHSALWERVGGGKPQDTQNDRQGSHSSLTSRYAVFLVIPSSAASCSATSRRVIPCAKSARARSSGWGTVARSSRVGLPVPATITVTSPRAGASA